MSFKQTLVLVGILALVAGYIYFLKITAPEKQYDEPPEVWSVTEEDIEHIKVTLPHKGKEISFSLDQEARRWYIDDEEKTPTDLKRWGGIVLLVSGPQSKKMIAEKVDDLGEFGLNDPQMIVTLRVKNLKDPLDIIFGNRTPEENEFYVKMRHSDPVYMINDTYCEVMMRLVTEPPIPPLIKANREARKK